MGVFSIETLPFLDGTIDIPLILYTVLFLLNLAICLRLIDDDRPRRRLSREVDALFHLFRCRCGLRRLEFNEILNHGQFLDLGANIAVPLVDSRLYLVLKGVVECRARTQADPASHHSLSTRIAG